MKAILRTLALIAGFSGVIPPPPVAAAELPPMDCVVEPNQVIDLSSAVQGVVQVMLVDRGDVVQQGQIVARLDSGVEQAALEYARARAAATSALQAEEITSKFADRRKDRLATLYDQKALSRDQMDETATSAQLKRLQLQQARENKRLAALDAAQADEIVKRLIIRSPIDGVVVQRFLSPGESVEDKPIMRLAQINPLRAEVIIPVAYFGSVRVGQTAIVVPEAPKNGQYPGVVTVVDRVADAASGTFRARVSLPNANSELPSGLRCSVKFLQAGESLSNQTIPPPPSARPRVAATPLARAGATPLARASAAPSIPAPPAAPSAAPRPVAPAAVTKAAVPAAARVASNPAVALASIPAVAAVPAIAAVPATSSSPVCHVVGPIASVSRADELRALLTRVAGRVTLRTEVTGRETGYAVLAPRTATPALAEALVGKLLAAGVPDSVVLSRGRYAGRVSVGLYAGPRTAEERQQSVGARGFELEVVPLTSVARAYWLDSEAPRVPAAVSEYLQTIATVAAANPAACPTAAVARN